ncbi:Hypothetical predicted protein [Mytilus galloprovincialis]|uniref:Uncharacterized protein n=1 Tax=Mytilus galloprovincialis TaxID=29158 RepID=A0A8B6FJW9_MYTGA|nr:Hypothetical predicted protein [Mytilus galloprovincialis]
MQILEGVRNIPVHVGPCIETERSKDALFPCEDSSLIVEFPDTEIHFIDDKDEQFWEIPNFHDDTVTRQDNMTEMVDSDGILGNEFYVVLDHIHRYQADINLDEFVLQKSKERFYMLKNDCQQNLNVYRTFEMVKMSQYL